MALTEREIRNRDRVLAMYREVHDAHDRTKIRKYLVEDYIQHSPAATDGLDGLGDFLDWLGATHPGHQNDIKRIFAQDDHVVVHVRVVVPGGTDLAVVDLFRLNDDGMLVEHWEVVQPVPDDPKNQNGMF